MLLRPSSSISIFLVPSRGCHKSELATCLSTHSCRSRDALLGPDRFKSMLLKDQGPELTLPAGTLTTIEHIHDAVRQRVMPARSLLPPHGI